MWCFICYDFTSPLCHTTHPEYSQKHLLSRNLGLMLKEKVDIDNENGAQISITAKKTTNITQEWSQILILEGK